MGKRLEDAIDNPDLIPTMSRGEQIAYEMGCAGFSLVKDGESKNYVEYRKVYADSSGTTGMVTAMLKKDDAGLEPRVLEGFVVTVQRHLRAIPEDVVEGAWAFAKDDLMHLINAIGAADEPSAENHILMFKCDECGTQTPDSIPFGKKKVCKSCFDKVGI